MLDGLFMLLTLSTVMAIAYSNPLAMLQLLIADISQVLSRRLVAPVLHHVTISTTTHLDGWNGGPSGHFPDSHHPRRRRYSLQRQRSTSGPHPRKKTPYLTATRHTMAGIYEYTTLQA